MKKIPGIILTVVLALLLVSCGVSGGTDKSDPSGTDASKADDPTTSAVYISEESPENTSTTKHVNNGEVIDLSKMNKVMMYTELYYIITQADDYVGQKIKMRGTYAVYGEKGQYLYACEIKDATACCSQGLEFVLTDPNGYPEYDPAMPAEIEVTGVITTCVEDGQTFVIIKDASLKVL